MSPDVPRGTFPPLPDPLPDPLPEVRLSPLSNTLDHWLPRPDRDPFDLSAPYQRGSVWTPAQRANLIRSLYMGVPTGSIITSVLPFRDDRPHDYRIVDGKQRIETVRLWAAARLLVPGWWFRPNDISPAKRSIMVGWDDLTEPARRRFANRPVPALQFDGQVEWLRPRDDGQGWVTRRRTEPEILAAEVELYELINTAGTPHTEADLARARAAR